MEHLSQRLAAAQITLANASAAEEAIQSTISGLQQRLYDAQQRYSAALAALRVGELDEPIAAARMATAMADASDLEAMITDQQHGLESAHFARQSAVLAVQDAELALAGAERQLTVAALDEQIKAIEAKLCGALAARYQLKLAEGSRIGSLFGIWTPSDALKLAVTQHIPPRG